MAGVDRLKDLLEMEGPTGPRPETPPPPSVGVRDPGVATGVAMTAYINANSRRLESDCKYLQDRIKAVATISAEYQRSTKDAERKERYTQFEDTCNEFKARFKESYNLLVKDNRLLGDVGGPIRTNLVGQNARRLEGLHREFLEVFDRVKKTIGDTNKRQLKIIVGDQIPEETLDKMDPRQMGQLYQQYLVSDNLRETVSLIEERHHGILHLEQSVCELAELFKDFATLIDIQQEQLNHIENNIEKSKAHVLKGGTELVEARVQQKKSRKKSCCLCSCLVIILLVVAGAILLPRFSSA